MRLAPVIASAVLAFTLSVDGLSRAGMCDGFDGLTFTFCVAMCEARECDRRPVDDERCGILRAAFDQMSGGAEIPCEPSAPPTQKPLNAL